MLPACSGPRLASQKEAREAKTKNRASYLLPSQSCRAASRSSRPEYLWRIASPKPLPFRPPSTAATPYPTRNATDDHGVLFYQKAKSRPATLFLSACPMTFAQCQRWQRHRMPLSNHHPLAGRVLLRFALLRLNCA